MIRIRRLHSATPARNLLDWFKKKGAKPVNSTKELIKSIESKKEIEETNVTKLDLNDKDNIIGQHFIKPVSLESLSFNHWLSKDKLANEKQLDAFINEITKDLNLQIDKPFPDILTRFKFFKKIQASTGYTLSDYQLTILTSPLSFKKYFVDNILSGKLLRFNIKEPNAIHISTETYNLPNVVVKESRPVREQKKILKQMLDEVKGLKETDIEQKINELKKK